MRLLTSCFADPVTCVIICITGKNGVIGIGNCRQTPPSVVSEMSVSITGFTTVCVECVIEQATDARGDAVKFIIHIISALDCVSTAVASMQLRQAVANEIICIAVGEALCRRR